MNRASDTVIRRKRPARTPPAAQNTDRTAQARLVDSEQPACTLVLHTEFFIALQGYAQASYDQAEGR
jgi:hypothetical protein